MSREAAGAAHRLNRNPRSEDTAMEKRQYSLLLRLYRDYSAWTDNGHFEWMRTGREPATVAALRADYGMDYAEIYRAAWNLRTPPSLLGIRRNRQGYFAARTAAHGSSRSCLLDFYSHDGIRLVRTGWLRPCDKRTA
jgi:hypothetical protein